MIMHILERLKAFDFQEVLVVTGYGEIIKIADQFSYRSVFNDAPEIGQSRSVVLGVTVSHDSEGWLFLNGDMPWLKEDTLHKIMEAAGEGRHIIVPRYDGCPGQPVYFPSRFYEELKMLTGDQGGRQIIRRHPEAVVYVDIEDSKQGIDIDTPEDYRLYRKTMEIKGEGHE